MGRLLSDICPSLRELVGYYLDSVEIMVSPIAFNSDDRSIFTVKKAYSPQVKNADVEISTDREANTGFQLEFKAPPKVGAMVGYSVKNNSNKKSMTTEWDMDHTHCDTKGVQWTYRSTASDLQKKGSHRLQINPGIHSGHWYIEEKMKGFRITITQVLGCKFRSIFLQKVIPYEKPVLICPKMAHTLEVTTIALRN